MPETAEKFHGHQPRDCGEHRTLGGRAWCFDCSEYCSPEAPCTRCELPPLLARLVAAESAVTRMRALAERWEQGITNLWAANEEEAVPATRAVRAVKADTLDACIRELRGALSAPHGPAGASVSPPGAPAAQGEAREAQEG